MNKLPARCACCYPILQGLDAIHPDVVDACRQLVRLLIGRVILYSRGVENHDVGEIATPQSAAILERKRACGERGESADRLGETDDMFLADILGQQTCEVPIGPGVIILEEKHAPLEQERTRLSRN